MTYQERKNQYKDRGLIDLLLAEEPRTKEELANIMHCTPRQARRLIQQLRMFFPVISYSSQRGYSLPPKLESINDMDAAMKVGERVHHTINEIKSRVDVLNKELKPLIAYLEELKKVSPEVAKWL